MRRLSIKRGMMRTAKPRQSDPAPQPVAWMECNGIRGVLETVPGFRLDSIRATCVDFVATCRFDPFL